MVNAKWTEYAKCLAVTARKQCFTQAREYMWVCLTVVCQHIQILEEGSLPLRILQWIKEDIMMTTDTEHMLAV